MRIYVILLLGFSCAAFAADGTLDTTFSTGGLFLSGAAFAQAAQANAAVVRNDGKIVIGGTVSNAPAADFALLILNSDGTVDGASHQNHVGPVGNLDVINGLAVQPDNKVVAVGQSTTLAGVSQFVIARYCVNGLLDATFGGAGVVVVDFLPVVTGPGPISARAFAVALTRDGRIVVVGDAQLIGNNAMNPAFYAVAVLNSDGTLDSSFAAGAGRSVYATSRIPQNISSVAKSVAIQSIGSADNIIFAGQGDVGAGALRFQIIRILSSGNLDLTFATNGVDQVVFNAGVNESANGVDIYPSGEIFAVGTSFSANQQAVLTRRLPNGGADITFNGTGLQIFSIAGQDVGANAVNIQNNTRVLIAGNHAGAGTDFFTARFTGAGALDTATFNPVTGYNLQSFGGAAVAHAAALQGDGTIIVAGSATVVTGQMAALRYLNNNTTDQVFVAPTITVPANNFSNCADNPPTIGGAAQNPSNITVYVNGIESGRTITAGSSNTWSFTPSAPLAVGSNTFQAVAEYKSGNMNAITAFACCGIGLGPQSCLSAAVRAKYSPACSATDIIVSDCGALV